jgi:hypothetical protein
MKKLSISFVFIGMCLILLIGCPPSEAPESYKLTLVSVGNGTTAPNGTMSVEIDNPTVSISANPKECNLFINWTVSNGDVVIADPSSTFTTATLSGDATIAANFERLSYTLTVTSGTEGRITAPASNPVPVFCGESTTISAEPGPGYVFSKWTKAEGDATIADDSSNPTTVVLAKGNATVHANFTQCSIAPTVAEAIPALSCPGGTVRLCVIDGVLGYGATWTWYKDSCGGSYVDTGECINVSPVENTTYYVRAEGGCGTTTCASIAVAINSLSTAPSGIDGIPVQPVCGGSTVTLNVAGGALGTGAGWVWYSGACGLTQVGSGATIQVSPTSTTTYYVRAVGSCNTTDCAVGTVNINSISIAPIGINASATNVCPGTPVTLTVTGGSLGAGAGWYWFNGSCGGSLVGTGTSINVTPQSTTTYFVRAQGTCNTTACANISINVRTQSIPPTQIIASTTTTCPGQSVTLTVSVGSLGIGANWRWYSGSCGGTQIGSGASIAVSPLSTTTYYVRAEGDCNITACAPPMTIAVRTLSTAPAGMNLSASTICGGERVTLSVLGGSLGTGANWVWYSGACGGSLIGSGSSINVFPQASTSYFVRAEGTCNITSCASATVGIYTVGLSSSFPYPCGSCESGYLNTTGDIRIGFPITISAKSSVKIACSSDGCVGWGDFVRWVVLEGNCTIANANSSTTTVTVNSCGNVRIGAEYTY